LEVLGLSGLHSVSFASEQFPDEDFSQLPNRDDRWGYIITGSQVPTDQLPLISRTIDIPYASKFCRLAFNITEPSDVWAINKYGGFNISYPRLALIGGEWDPWRAATPLAIGQPERADTIEEPWRLITMGVHHWDENGLFPNETTATLPPTPVKLTQSAEEKFVRAWIAEWSSEGTIVAVD
jgi:hypothetical protein